MSRWEDYLPAHLSPWRMRELVEQQTPAEEWTGTPLSPETVLDGEGYAPDDSAQLGELCTSPPIVSVRQAGVSGSELLLVIDGQQIVVELSWGHLCNLLQDIAEAIARAEG